MTVISPLLSLIIALLFHMTKVMPFIIPLMIVIIALLSVIIQLVSVMTAVMTDMTKVMPFIIRIVWHTIRILCLTKKLVSGPIATMTDPDRGAKNPTIASRLGREADSREASREGVRRAVAERSPS